MKLTPLGLQPMNGYSAFLLERDDATIVLDAGNSLYTPLYLAPLRRIKTKSYVVITHRHADHCAALTTILKAQDRLVPISVYMDGSRHVPFFKQLYVGKYLGVQYGENEMFLQLVPSGHCDIAAAVLIKEYLFYTGDYHSFRTLQYHGLRHLSQVPFVLSEGSMLLVINTRNPLAPNEYVPLPQKAYFAYQMLIHRIPQYAQCNLYAMHKNVLSMLLTQREYQICNYHADYRSVVYVTDACYPYCLMLVHCDRPSTCYNRARMLAQLLPCQVELAEGCLQCAKISQQRTVYRKKFHAKLSKFSSKCEKAGILLDGNDDALYIGRNVFLRSGKKEVTVCWVDATEVQPFLEILEALGKKNHKESYQAVDDFWK